MGRDRERAGWRSGLVLLGLAGLGAVLWWSSRPDRASVPLARGLAAYRDGRAAAALRWANEALERSPGDSRAEDLKQRALAWIGRAGPGRPVVVSESPRTTLIEAVRSDLGAGRPRDALGRLEPFLALGPDPEASWLMSRAWLQLGELPRASLALEEADDFGDDDPTRPEPAPFVGAGRCVPCHAEIVRDQARTRHARTLRTGAQLADVPLPDRPVTDPLDARVSHAFRRDDEGVEVEARTDRDAFRTWIDFAVGSGDRGMSFIGRDAQQQPRLLRISTFDHHQILDVTPMTPRAAREPGEYLGLRITDSFPDCLGCHSTKIQRSVDGVGFEPFDGGVRCERCHGPAGNHVRAVELGFSDWAIARPKLASADQLLKLCAQCHQPPRGRVPSASDPTLVRQQSLTLPRSECYTASNGALRCVTCHSPHRDAETSPAYYEAKCLECHSPEPAPADRSTASRMMSAVACPIDATRRCVDCHMPKVENPAEHAWFTDHHIRVHREASPSDAEAGAAGQAVMPPSTAMTCPVR